MEKKYKYILLPLDGSELAEVAIADAAAIARPNNAEITLLRVLRPITDVIKIDTKHVIYIDDQLENRKRRAYEYLKSISDQLKKESIISHTVVEMGLPEENIIDYAYNHSIDIIVMATHGRTGLKRWVYGSVADKVLRGSRTSILLSQSFPEKAVEKATN